MRYSYDWAQYVLDLPMEIAPGEKFEYCNGVSYLLSVIIQNMTKLKTLDFARQHLFDPMGIKDVEWEKSPQGVNIGYGEMWLQPHDMAKIGLLYLNEGSWGERQILPSAWIEVSTRAHIAAKPFDQYGYHWWVESDGIYAAAGYKGQRIFIVPDKDLVAVITARLTAIESTTSDYLLASYILPAVASDSKLPANIGGQTRLRELAKKAAMEPGN
jgi:CubicO group peptidase (beta-lactamase class C family)